MEWRVTTKDGRTLAVEARFYDNEGHGLRRKHIGEVHAWLAERS